MNNSPDTNKIQVYLSNSSPDTDLNSLKLKRIMERAGLHVICPSPSVEDNLWSKAACLVHVIGREYGISLGEYSVGHYEFQQIAEKNNLKTDNFRIFVWQPGNQFHDLAPEQQQFVKFIQQNLSRNMVFSTQNSPVMFVEDLRSIMYSRKTTHYQAIETDVFFVFNEIDEILGREMASLLGDIMRVEILSLAQGYDNDYGEMVNEQMKNSKLTVVFFQKAYDWALQFTKQVWRSTGGASSPTHLMMLGDEAEAINNSIHFDAPNVTSLTTARELMPLEIKVMFDKLNTAVK